MKFKIQKWSLLALIYFLGHLILIGQSSSRADFRVSVSTNDQHGATNRFNETRSPLTLVVTISQNKKITVGRRYFINYQIIDMFTNQVIVQKHQDFTVPSKYKESYSFWVSQGDNWNANDYSTPRNTWKLRAHGENQGLYGFRAIVREFQKPNRTTGRFIRDVTNQPPVVSDIHIFEVFRTY